MKQTLLIDYKKLRRVSPKAARMAVLNYLSSSGHNITKTAKVFGLERSVIYNIIKKQKEKNLHDRSKAPKHIRNKTTQDIIKKILEAKNKTKFGPRKLFNYLQLRYGLYVAYGTIRSILRRNEDRIV